MRSVDLGLILQNRLSRHFNESCPKLAGRRFNDIPEESKPLLRLADNRAGQFADGLQSAGQRLEIPALVVVVAIVALQTSISRPRLTKSSGAAPLG